jgi:hypothetical protein
MLIVSIQGRKRRDLLKDSKCKSIEVNKHRVGVEHLWSSTQAHTTNEAGDLDHLLLNYWEIHGVFRVNISTNDIDLWKLIMLQFIDTLNDYYFGSRPKS